MGFSIFSLFAVPFWLVASQYYVWIDDGEACNRILAKGLWAWRCSNILYILPFGIGKKNLPRWWLNEGEKQTQRTKKTRWKHFDWECCIYVQQARTLHGLVRFSIKTHFHCIHFWNEMYVYIRTCPFVELYRLKCVHHFNSNGNIMQSVMFFS